MIRSFEGDEPEIADTAYVAESAVVIGDVTIGDDASVWPGAVLRGDHGEIVLREGSNVQDNATLHEGAQLGPYATVGHNAIVHSATVGERAMVGMGAVVLNEAEIGAESLVGANSTVTEGTVVPESTMAAGSPAEVVKDVENSPWAVAGDHYVDLAKRHARSSTVIERGAVGATPEEDG